VLQTAVIDISCSIVFGTCSSMAVESPLSSPKKCESVVTAADGSSANTDVIPSVTSAAESVVSSLQQSQACGLPGVVQVPDLPAPVHGPAPRCVSSDELHVLQTCLTRWRTEVEQDVKGELYRGEL
jgi:hypothetical protein